MTTRKKDPKTPEPMRRLRPRMYSSQIQNELMQQGALRAIISLPKTIEKQNQLLSELVAALHVSNSIRRDQADHSNPKRLLADLSESLPLLRNVFERLVPPIAPHEMPAPSNLFSLPRSTRPARKRTR